MMRICGSCANARATSTIRNSPPESVVQSRSASALKPSRSMAAHAAASSSGVGDEKPSKAGVRPISTISRTVKPKAASCA